MPENLLIKLIGAKRVHFINAWLELNGGGTTPALHGIIQHVKNGPKHEHKFLHTKKGWVKC